MEIYDVPQLSQLLRVAPKTVRSYISSGRLMGRKVAKRWLVTEDALRRFLIKPEDRSLKNPDIHMASSPPNGSHEKFW